jgi:RND family efflux transporter MFP subunit
MTGLARCGTRRSLVSSLVGMPHLRVVAAGALLLMCGVMCACAPQAEDGTVEFRVPVTVKEVGVATLEDRIVTTGTLRPSELVSLSALDAGVLEINEHSSGRRFAEGDPVRAGDEIARIVGEDVRIAARMAAARRSFEGAETELGATRSLFERGLINQIAVDKAEKAYEEEKLEFERSRRTQQRNRLVTPISGVILALARNQDGQLLANGQLVSPGQIVVQVAPLHPLVADVELVGGDIAAAAVDLEARAHYHAWPREQFPGKVLRLAPTVDQRTRALRVEVEIDNHMQRLRPGMFVEVTLVGERRENVPVVPRSAVADRGGRPVVFVMRQQYVEQQAVELGLHDDERVEVRAGVTQGDLVVVSGLETLTDKMPVRVMGR